MVNMSRIILNNNFRTTFSLKNKSILRWFPGHMGKGVNEMQKKLKSVDCIIEVHDARIPFSGRNPEAFQTISGLRPHILVYNKRDLADESLELKIVEQLNVSGLKNVVFTSCKDISCSGIKKLIPIVQREILGTSRHNRSENHDKCLMVIGVPNVGKSSLINVLRQKYLLRTSAARVGAAPGITRSVGNKIKISDDPLIYVYDTPGILTPKVPSVDDGMKLALCATIPDKEVGIELIADYLLFWMNKNENFRYVNFIGIEQPNDDITEVLIIHAVKNNFFIKIREFSGGYAMKPDISSAANSFVNAFRRGLFGPITLDIDKMKSQMKKSTFVIHRKGGL